MSESRPRRKVSLVTVVVLVLTTAVSTAVIAGHEFNDVPNSNQFHGSISWMADNEITVGCNDAGDQFCPDDNVRRETMASFMRRFAQTFGAASDTVTESGAANQIPIDSTTPIEIASVDVTPKAEANVTLNAHVVLASSDSSGGNYHISRETCGGDVVAMGAWQINGDATFVLQANTWSATGADVIDTATTYVFCVEKDQDVFPDALAAQRGLTATWSPTS